MNATSDASKGAAPFCSKGILGTSVKLKHFSLAYFSQLCKMHFHIFTELRATALCLSKHRRQLGYKYHLPSLDLGRPLCTAEGGSGLGQGIDAAVSLLHGLSKGYKKVQRG